MLQTRVIPCLLLKGSGFVKTIRFQKPTYLGDPLNIVRIFNDKEVDEAVVLDIEASPAQRPPNFTLIEKIATECFMPLGYGGGIRTIEDMERLFTIGIEKVVLNTAAVEDPDLVSQAAQRFGSQSVVVSIDVKTGLFGRSKVVIGGGRKSTPLSPLEHARRVEQLGAGEILLTSIDRDGTGAGFDLPLIQSVSSQVSIPVVACGGAKTVEDLRQAVQQGGASAAAAGSMFVFHGEHRAVLISYPSQTEIQTIQPSAHE